MSSRAQKRPGFASLGGAQNPRLTSGSQKPLSPSDGAWHFDEVRATMSRYNGTTWDEFNLLYVSDTEPTNTNLLWYDTGS